MSFRLSGITIDCLDPVRVSAFWAALLGGEPEPHLPGWAALRASGDVHGRPRLNFQPVAEPKRGKTRIHLDLTVPDIGAGVATVLAAGGRGPAERHEYPEGVVVVMADPEGHEFCLVEYFDHRTDGT